MHLEISKTETVQKDSGLQILKVPLELVEQNIFQNWFAMDTSFHLAAKAESNPGQYAKYENLNPH